MSIRLIFSIMARGQKTGGRQKGTPNRISYNVKELINNLLRDELHKMPSLLNKMSPKERVDTTIKLLPFLLPKADEVQAPTKTMKETHSFITDIFSKCQLGSDGANSQS